MPKLATKTLLKDPQVVEEINRHLWIESEKAGRDIGFDRAAEDWVEKYSTEWMKINKKEKSTKMSRQRTRKTRVL